MSAVTEAVAVPVFQHWCNRLDAPINEFDPAIVDCRCYTSYAFFAAQDAMAVRLDLERSRAGQ